MSTTAPPLLQPTRFRHEALLWHGRDELLAGTVPVIDAALTEGLPVMVALTGQTWGPIRAALGHEAASRVHHVDMTQLGTNPARIIPAWLDFLASCGGRPARGINEPLWAGRRRAEVTECHVQEAALNLAIPAGAPLSLLCPYNGDSLDASALSQARRTHPLVATAWGSAHSDHYRGTGRDQTLGAGGLPRPPLRSHRLAFRRGELGEVRRFVIRHATAAGVGDDRSDDLALAVNELAANSIDHGGGRGVARVWRDHGALVVEVSDSGRIADPLAGRLNPGVAQERGRGLWIANQLCDLLQVRSTREGTALRVVTWLPTGA